MNQPDLQMQYLHRKLRIQPVAGNSNFHNMLIHTKSFQIQIPNTKKKNTDWKRTQNTTFFWAIENRCRKLCQFCPPWKLGGVAANDNLFSCQFLPFVSFFATFCQYLSPSIFLSISQFRLQFSPIPPLGQLSKWAFTLRCLFPSILLPPSAAQIRKIRKHANTQIRRYPNTPKHKNANTVEDGFHAPLFRPTPRLLLSCAFATQTVYIGNIIAQKNNLFWFSQRCSCYVAVLLMSTDLFCSQEKVWFCNSSKNNPQVLVNCLSIFSQMTVSLVSRPSCR